VPTQVSRGGEARISNLIAARRADSHHQQVPSNTTQPARSISSAHSGASTAISLTRDDVAKYRNGNARDELPIPDPERHLGLRVSRLDDLAKGLAVEGDVEINDLGHNFEVKDDEYSAERRRLPRVRGDP
jgi:hypothetical protein